LSVGLIALLDDVAAIAKIAAASLDDAMALAAKAGAKAAGVVIDDAAVTPRYVLGFGSERELPIVRRIAAGSLRNKLLVLLPATLALSYFLPRMITPLLMLGGAYLCHEGTEKVLEGLVPNRAHADGVAPGETAPGTRIAEDAKVASAIRTDLILSAEIMAIALAVVSDQTILTQTIVLTLVGVGITIAVYGLVALIVKADDIGVALATSGSASVTGAAGRVFGRALVLGMPGFLKLLSAIGTAAMIWVGGGIILHGLPTYHAGFASSALDGIGDAIVRAMPSAAGILKQAAEVFLFLIAGLLVGSASLLLVRFVAAPASRLLKRTLRRTQGRTFPAE
jgi:uncharacterized protein